MNAQCPCVQGEERIPDSSCRQCQGSGFIRAFFPAEDDIEAYWVGRCPLCGAGNGMSIQKKGKPKPEPHPYRTCVNDDCEQPMVELVRIETVTAWGAHCSICNALHYANFQQREGDTPPTIETHPRTCPGCGSSDMTWKLGTEICRLMGF